MTNPIQDFAAVGPEDVLAVIVAVSRRRGDFRREVAVARLTPDGTVFAVGLWAGEDAEAAARVVAGHHRPQAYLDGFSRLSLLALADAEPSGGLVFNLRTLYRRMGRGLKASEAPRDALGQAAWLAVRLRELGPLPAPEPDDEES